MVELALISPPPQMPTESSESAQNPDPPQPNTGTQEHLSYKNQLQQYTQKLSLPLPVYQTRNEGSPHDPMFRATVWVDDICCTSRNVFKNIKSAEQEVAKTALDALMQKVKDEGSPHIREDPVYCKSILHEFAVKMHLDMPTYQTTKQQHDKFHTFTTLLVFNNTSFTGPAARSKKEAEQLAARVVILSIIGIPGPNSAFISKIIKSKYQPELNKGNAPNNNGHASSSLLNKETENVCGGLASNMATTAVVENHLGLVVRIPEPNQPFHEFKKPKLDTEHSPTVPIVPPIVFVPPVHEQPQGAGPSPGKKQHKRAKRNHVPTAQLPTPGVSSTQVFHPIPH